MSKEKQIEEMAEDIGKSDFCKHLPKELCNKRSCSQCMAEIIYEAGYRKMPENIGELSDGYHTFNELYEYRLLYNAAFFNELAKQRLYDVHKSRKHSDGENPFGDPNWFIVMAELPTGQISNHYEMKDWDLFQVTEKYISNVWDGHDPRDVAKRIRKYLENHDEDTTISNNQRAD